MKRFPGEISPILRLHYRPVASGRNPRSLLLAGSILAGLALLTISVAAQRLVISFDDDAIGAPPDGFFFAAARQASPGTWEVLGKGTRRHLSHSADPTVTLRGISVAGFSYTTPDDVRVTTRLHLSDGDRAGGVIWRYRDSNNFYFMAVVYATHSAGLFRVTGGNRVSLHNVTDIDLDPDAWHSLTVVHDGEDILGTIDGIGVLRARDRTLTDGNRAGVWSAGNTTGWFDDVTIERAPD
jgi:hypothetical protein